MRYVWDEEKNRVNIAKRGFDFADAGKSSRILCSPPRMIASIMEKTAWIGIGMFSERIIVVVYTEPTDDTIRVISVRKAMKNERKAYEEKFRDRPEAN